MFVEAEKIILNFIWKRKHSENSQDSLEEEMIQGLTVPDFQISCRGTVIKKVWVAVVTPRMPASLLFPPRLLLAPRSNLVQECLSPKTAPAAHLPGGYPFPRHTCAGPPLTPSPTAPPQNQYRFGLGTCTVT